MARDILKTLQEEHDKLRKLFDEIKGTTDRAEKTREQLLETIEQNLLPHAKWEEQVFYPAFKERADRDGLQTLAEACSEHHAVENSVIPEVHAADVADPGIRGPRESVRRVHRPPRQGRREDDVQDGARDVQRRRTRAARRRVRSLEELRRRREPMVAEKAKASVKGAVKSMLQ